MINIEGVDGVKVYGDRVVIKPEEVPSKTSSGLYIPDICKEKSITGVVKFVGPDCVDVSVGDRVIYNVGPGFEFMYNEESLLLIREGDVHAVV